MTIFVTGGTGLVGSRLLRRFVDAGVDCRALVRPGKEVPAGATRVEGDLLDADSLRQAVEGVSAIVTSPPFSGRPIRMRSGGPISTARAISLLLLRRMPQRLDSLWRVPALCMTKTPRVQVWRTMRSIRSLRILRAKLPPKTSFEVAGSPGASSVSHLFMATETNTWLQCPG